ncbi:MAG TPA: response regulator [Ideonella sp.]|uniref:response regulator n=1 Tax=Ideonella sp. TaxID=1929293 RepID=UPI002B7E57BE|nr:response regulator [Ideonella sp.]HSI47243.1 response regulator [Ideonella sp.]
MPFSSYQTVDRRDHLVLAAALLFELGLLLVDVLTPLGFAEWVLYLLPLSLSLLQRRPRVPYLLLGVALVFTYLGLIFSPPGSASILLLHVNRGMGAMAFVVMAVVVSRVLRQREAMQRQLWLQQAESALAQRLAGELTIEQVGEACCAMLCGWLTPSVAAAYRRDGERLLRFGSHAADLATLPATLTLQDGLLGEAARQDRFNALSPAPEGHLGLQSALGRSLPEHLLLMPLHAEGRNVGVIELGVARATLDLPLCEELALRVSEVAGVALRSAVYRLERQAMLEETQRQAEELQAQQEELRVSNEELEEQGRIMRESQAELETQQTELERVNGQLALHARAMADKQQELLQSQAALQANAEALEAASRYKSEFLANMSHELRTPLNSSLILSQLLAANKEGRLSEEQVRFARAIFDANNDLLALINDVLDLSKIEAGHADLQRERVPLRELATRLQTVFAALAEKKGLGFEVALDPGLPEHIFSDSRRLQQVLKNLLANAVKFTVNGKVTLALQPLAGGAVRFEVRDTGVGIPADKHEVIFEAFRQADGSTSRQFGGTGLGLSISRELTQRLGGTLALHSTPGQGSTFTVDLPAELPEQPAPDAPRAPHPAAPALPPAAGPAAPKATAPPIELPPGLGRDRRVLLAVEDDSTFAATLRTLVEELGFDCVVANNGEQALALARELRPSGVLLDVGLPDVSGLSVLERLKRDPGTRHIPVHVVSGLERSHAALTMGAIGHLVKPALREHLVEAIERLRHRLDHPLRRVLVVEDDAELRQNLQLLLAAPQVEITTVGTVADALTALGATTFDCMVTDLALPDGSGFDLLERMARGEREGFPPVIVYTGRALSRDEETLLRRYSRSIIVKGARSPERLLDEVTLFLHSVEAALPGEQQRLLQAARSRDAVLEGRQILLAEDDVRNIFALSSVLEPLGVQLQIARNGREALERLDRQPPVDLVLMDIMMPEMDGLEAMRRIRARPDGADLPIIALTAKAMADDRQQCLEAGANDYLAKPIDVDRLVSLCRVWMPK